MIPISLSVLAQIGVCFNRFWSSDKLTGSQTLESFVSPSAKFWSSDKLTGSQTVIATKCYWAGFGAVTN